MNRAPTGLGRTSGGAGMFGPGMFGTGTFGTGMFGPGMFGAGGQVWAGQVWVRARLGAGTFGPGGFGRFMRRNRHKWSKTAEEMTGKGASAPTKRPAGTGAGADRRSGPQGRVPAPTDEAARRDGCRRRPTKRPAGTGAGPDRRSDPQGRVPAPPAT